MSDFYVAGIYLIFIVLGFVAPFVFTLGYEWVDTFDPQLLSTVLVQIPVAMVMGICAIAAYVVGDRKSPPRFSAHMALTLIFAAWMTMTLFWAELPEVAPEKWNWAFKTVVFSVFLRLVIRSRVQIEAFLQIFLFSVLVHFLPLGIKMALSGSSYGMQRGIIRANTGFAESSTVSAVCIALIPLVMYLRAHAILIPKSRWRDIGYLALIPVLVLAAISTYARTALVGFVVLAAYFWLRARRKAVFTTVMVVGVLCAAPFLAASWEERISTVTDFEQENSALGRLLAWQWTLGYVADHPVGGSFDVYLTDHIEFPGINGQAPVIRNAIAFHSMYFEVLGETGYPGLAMFLGLQGMSLWYLLGVMRRARGQPHLAWCGELAAALMASLLTIMTCGNFIGIGFQATIWYFMAIPVCLREYVYRVEQLDRKAGLAKGALPPVRGRALMPLARGMPRGMR